VIRKYLKWQNILAELNNFSSRIEFLESEMRNVISDRKEIDFEKYLASLKLVLNEHEKKIYANANSIESKILHEPKEQKNLYVIRKRKNFKKVKEA
jgi:hypothetical protein